MTAVPFTQAVRAYTQAGGVQDGACGWRHWQRSCRSDCTSEPTPCNMSVHALPTGPAAPSLLPVYAIAAIPLGSIPTTASFCALSLMHFARDLGVRLSFALHGLAGLVFLVDQNLSFMLMTVYSLIYHIPSAHRPHRGAMQRHARI